MVRLRLFLATNQTGACRACTQAVLTPQLHMPSSPLLEALEQELAKISRMQQNLSVPADRLEIDLLKRYVQRYYSMLDAMQVGEDPGKTQPPLERQAAADWSSDHAPGIAEPSRFEARPAEAPPIAAGAPAPPPAPPPPAAAAPALPVREAPLELDPTEPQTPKHALAQAAEQAPDRAVEQAPEQLAEEAANGPAPNPISTPQASQQSPPTSTPPNPPLSTFKQDAPQAPEQRPQEPAAPSTPMEREARPLEEPVQASSSIPASAPEASEPEYAAAKHGLAASESLNERFAQQVEAAAAHPRLKDQPLGKRIDLNERALFVRELFGGSRETFETAVRTIDGFEDLAMAHQYLSDELSVKHQWSAENRVVAHFRDLVEQGFA